MASRYLEGRCRNGSAAPDLTAAALSRCFPVMGRNREMPAMDSYREDAAIAITAIATRLRFLPGDIMRCRLVDDCLARNPAVLGVCRRLNGAPLLPQHARRWLCNSCRAPGPQRCVGDRLSADRRRHHPAGGGDAMLTPTSPPSGEGFNQRRICLPSLRPLTIRLSTTI
jgi:hypothetical protein